MYEFICLAAPGIISVVIVEKFLEKKWKILERVFAAVVYALVDFWLAFLVLYPAGRISFLYTDKGVSVVYGRLGIPLAMLLAALAGWASGAVVRYDVKNKTVRMIKRLLAHRKIMKTLLVCLLVAAVGLAGDYFHVFSYISRQYRLSGEQWYEKQELIMHALGEIDGLTYTNSKEALENAYENGARMFECDFNMTSDGELAAVHDWSRWLTWSESAQAENSGGGVRPDA